VPGKNHLTLGKKFCLHGASFGRIFTRSFCGSIWDGTKKNYKEQEIFFKVMIGSVRKIFFSLCT